MAEMVGISSPTLSEMSTAPGPKTQANADLKFLNDDKIAVLAIHHWYGYADSEHKVTFGDFLQNSFEQIRQTGSSSLIIDLRDNDGGRDELGKQLFAYLLDHPFRYYNDLVINAREFDFFKYAPNAKPVPLDLVEQQSDGKFHFTKHPNWGLQQPRQPHFAGRVFALMNGGSFSTSCEFLSVLHYHKRGIFIGEEAAGGYYGNTSGRFYADVTLPNSKLIVHLGLVTYYLAASGYKYPDRSVIPDYAVTHTISDLLAGKDKDMELALSLARRK
jgi:C-terminal processing protease CtpA/Prc